MDLPRLSVQRMLPRVIATIAMALCCLAAHATQYEVRATFAFAGGEDVSHVAIIESGTETSLAVGATGDHPAYRVDYDAGEAVDMGNGRGIPLRMTILTRTKVGGVWRVVRQPSLVLIPGEPGSIAISSEEGAAMKAVVKLTPLPAPRG
jgi:hypothetical protein